MSELKVNKVTPRSGTTVTLGDSGDTITIPSGVTITNNGTQTGFGGANTPAFEAYLSANQNVSNDTATKITADTEIYDTAGQYDNSTNYRFTPLTAGKYFVYGSVFTHAGNTALAYSQLFIYKNGASIKVAQQDNGTNPLTNTTLYISAVVDMNGSSDYVELFGTLFGNVSTFQFLASTKANYFGAYKIIE
jgi:hypothetical protein